MFRILIRIDKPLIVLCQVTLYGRALSILVPITRVRGLDGIGLARAVSQILRGTSRSQFRPPPDEVTGERFVRLVCTVKIVPRIKEFGETCLKKYHCQPTSASTISISSGMVSSNIRPQLLDLPRSLSRLDADCASFFNRRAAVTKFASSASDAALLAWFVSTGRRV